MPAEIHNPTDSRTLHDIIEGVPTMSVGDTVHATIYGHRVPVLILKVLPFGTYDVQRLDDGRCFRVSGMALCD